MDEQTAEYMRLLTEAERLQTQANAMKEQAITLLQAELKEATEQGDKPRIKDTKAKLRKLGIKP